MIKLVAPGTAMIAVTYAFSRFSFGLFLPEISDALHLSESQSGFVGTLGYISYAFALLCSNLMIKRFGQTIIIYACGITSVIGLLAIALSPNLFFLGIGICTAGLGSGWSSPVYSKVAKTSLSLDKRDQANSWMNTGTSFGVIISGPIALFFANHWRRAFLFFAFLSAITLIWNLIAIPSPSENDKNEMSFSLNYRALLSRTSYLLPASLLIGMSTSIYWTFSRSYLTAVYQLTTQISIAFWLVMGIAGIGGSFAGKLISLKGLSAAFRIFLILLMSSIALIVISNTIALYSSAIIFGISYIAITGVLLVWGTRCFPESPYIGVSLSFFFLGIGQTIGSSLAGFSIEYLSYSTSFLLFSGIGILALFMPIKTNHKY
ncbi:MFS transporter [Marinilactibacillus kalidii]|uniref:MFS transporter n=1 Tax=Marinilactibacillus kalidii TaxID=2820274 RepID=UPI001ABDD5CC|nr:MFS transporter [Marinilactibacillus kalidii]